MNQVAGVDDYVGGRVEGVYVGDRLLEIQNSLIGVRRVESDMGIGYLRDDHDAETWPADYRPA